MTPDWREGLLRPRLATAGIPGIGGTLRGRPEDFRVDEIPAYGADGVEDRHLLFCLTKRGLTTEMAVGDLARHCGLPRAAFGVAGLKDRDAVTTQWVSAPVEAATALAALDRPDLRVEKTKPHSHKLRRGHLRGNRFEIVVRDLACDVDEALARVSAKTDALTAAGGLWNRFGFQRLGPQGANVDRGLEILRRGRAHRRDHFLLSALQSGLFNLHLERREQAGTLRRVLVGDLLRKRDTGGMFVSASAADDQPRLEAGEVEITGPMYGSKMREPTPESPAAAEEAATLAEAGLSRQDWEAMGKAAPGARRSLQVDVEVRAELAPPVDDLGPGVLLRFALPAGSFATVLCSELQEDGS